MSDSAGFLSNAAAVAGVTTSYDLAKIVTLTGYPQSPANPPSPAVTMVDARARRVPQSARWQDMAVLVAVTAGAPTKLYAKVYWDVLGEHPALAEGTIDLDPAMTTATNSGGMVLIDLWRTFPSIATSPGILYVVFMTDAGTVTISRVRMDWNDRG